MWVDEFTVFCARRERLGLFLLCLLDPPLGVDVVIVVPVVDVVVVDVVLIVVMFNDVVGVLIVVGA